MMAGKGQRTKKRRLIVFVWFVLGVTPAVCREVSAGIVLFVFSVDFSKGQGKHGRILIVFRVLLGEVRQT